MPQTPARPGRSDGEFADLFARKARTPLRGFLPGRRVWNAVGGSAAAVLVIAGSASAVSAIDWSTGDSDKVTTAVGEKVPKEKTPANGAEKPTVDPNQKAVDSTNTKKNPEIVYVPVQGGSGAGGAADAPGSTQRSDPADTSGGGSGSQAAATSSAPSATPTGYLWSDGGVDADTNDYWDQSTVTVKSTKPLTSLKVVVKIIQTGGVSSTGTWSSLGDRISVATGGDSGELDYVVTLKSGNTLGPGTYAFKFQYNHKQGRRDAGGDRYNVTATSTGSVTEYHKGAF
ncbi:hypothetical protein [Streptomyces graminilatus]|uniref:hypothetical protein n=1 Tax=Streptomyces graminilatus TaxID=1464070 RepID=UPI0006E4239E|nr:hypothetical protein [Streptomyces graminilatus]